MTKITYLLGAGASATVLPINRKITTSNAPRYILDEFKEFRDFLVHRGLDSTVVQKIDRILEICREMGTPDLCSKRLLETNDIEGYKLVTRFISNFFNWKQKVSEIKPEVFNSGSSSFEVRALSFLTTISQNRKLPPNVKLISWNYDRQIEVAAAKLRLIGSAVTEKIQGFSTWPNVSEGQEIDYKSQIPFLFHINGIAGYDYSPRDFAVTSEDFSNFDVGSECLLSFAWEDNNNCEKRTFTDRRLEIASRVVAETDVLVVIGYTFPFFNREFDRHIFKNMGNNLKTIYIQDPVYTGTQLREQFDLGRNTQIMPPITDTSSYYIPYEL